MVVDLKVPRYHVPLNRDEGSVLLEVDLHLVKRSFEALGINMDPFLIKSPLMIHCTGVSKRTFHRSPELITHLSEIYACMKVSCTKE